LFSFRVREGEEEPSDDSDDSDYYIGRKSTDEDEIEERLKNYELIKKRKKKYKLEMSEPKNKKLRSSRLKSMMISIYN